MPYLIIYHSAELLFLIPFILMLLKKIRFSEYLKPFLIFLFLNLIADFAMTALALNHIKNVWLSRIYEPIEFSLFIILFYRMAPKHHKKLIFILGIAAVLFFLFADILLRVNQGPNAYGMSLSSLALLFISARFLGWSVEKGRSEIFLDPRFYITIAILLNSGMSILLFILFSFSHFQLPYILNLAVGFISEFLYAYALYCYFKREKIIMDAVSGL